MAINCDPNSLQNQAKCFHCLSPLTLQEVQTYLLCQIANNPSGGGTSVLPNGQIFVGNAANVATAVAMSGDATIVNTGAVTLANSALTRSHLGLGTADAPQFARLGVGVAADATKPLLCRRDNVGNTEIAEFEDTTGNPFITLGTTLANAGCFWLYDRAANKLSFSVHGSPPAFTGDSVGNLDVTANINAGGGYSTATIPGISPVLNFPGTNTMTFNGGILTAFT